MLMFDIEVLPNYFLATFKKYGKDKYYTFEIKGKYKSLKRKDIDKLFKLINKHTIVTFNGIKYDFPITSHAIEGKTAYELYELSKNLINGDVRYWDVTYPSVIDADHIDLIDVAPGKGSLKLYGTRVGSKKLWEFPLEHDATINKKQMKLLKKYNINDLIVTEDLYNALKGQIQLRIQMSEQYGVDLRSKSDAQIAEIVLVKEVGVTEKPTHHKVVTYKAPNYIKFKSKELKELLKRIESTKFEINQANGSPILPKWLSEKQVIIGNTSYNIGIGGLHSQEKSMVVKEKLINADFSSFYPFIILELGLYPKHLGLKFLDVYRDIVERRLQAKASGDNVVADSLKVTINGSFGKFGNIYSKLYSPDLLISVTLTGQLTLLMIIESLEKKGVSVVSANTDGLELIYNKKAKKIIEKCIKDTNFIMEYGEYNALYAENVNNYIAVYDGYTKAKGIYAEPSLMKNPQTQIVFEAIRKYLLDGTSIEDTIKSCKDINKFITARTVRGGAMWCKYDYSKKPKGYDESLKRYGRVTKVMQNKMRDLMKRKAEYVGKVVRFYYAKEGGFLFYKESGNTVPLSDGCKPLMDLQDSLPLDIDYEWYLNYAKRKLGDLGL